MPTASPPKPKQGCVTQPFDNSTDDSQQPSPAVENQPSPPNHDLMEPSAASVDNPTTVEVVEVPEVVIAEPVSLHVSEGYSKLQLHKKWTEAVARTNRLTQNLVDVTKEKKLLEKKLKEAEKSRKLDLRSLSMI